VMIDYTTSAPGAPADATAFAWTPPQGATQLKPQAADAGDLMADANNDEDASKKLVGQPAPAFTLEDLDGKKVSIADQKGSVVVLDFWATWCPPCREGMPHLDELYKSKQADGVKVFAINLREDRDKAKAFLDSKNLSLPVLLDANGEVAKAYLVGGIPQTVVIGKDGVVKHVVVGFGEGSAQALADIVDQVLQSK
jgi:peroxiredoxin